MGKPRQNLRLNQKRKGKHAQFSIRGGRSKERNNVFERQEENGYCYIDLWNEDFEAVKEEDEAEDFLWEDEKREKENMPMMAGNEDDPIRRKNKKIKMLKSFQ